MAVVYAYSPMVFAAEIQELEGLRTANTRAWAPIVEQADGILGPDPGAGYTELAGGLHWNAAQSGDEPIWLPTRLDWESDPKGGAMILEAPRTARLAPKLTDMPMLAIHPQDAETPPLAFAFHGLGYWNRATGAFAWIGHAQPAKLELAGNIGYYADALQGLSATWVVEHKLTGVGAGLLLHQAPLPPTAYGFAASDPVDLVVVSEMIDLNADLRLSLSGRSGAEQELESLSRLQATGFEDRPIDFFGADSNTPHRIDRGYAYWTVEGLQLGADLNPESPEDAADAADREVGVRTALVRTDEGRLLLTPG